MNFTDSMKNRRSYYNISKESTVSDEKLIELIKTATTHTPSAYNSQIQRVCLLLKDNHDDLWDITLNTLKAIVPKENFAPTQEKIDSFKGGYGTILYFNDTSITKDLQEKFPMFKDNFPKYAMHAIGMLQFAIWNMLELNGLGASLQHYNPLIDEEVKKRFGIESSWELIAQMPFGKPTGDPGEKTFEDIEKRVKIFI